MNATSDKRQISSLVIDYNQRVRDWNPAVGTDGVTNIAAYDENGYLTETWFAIYVGEELVWRVNGKFVVAVNYARS